MLGVGAGFLRTYSISCHVFTPPPPKARDHTRPAHGFGVFSSRNQVPERCSRETPRNPNELHSISGNARCHALHARMCSKGSSCGDDKRRSTRFFVVWWGGERFSLGIRCQRLPERFIRGGSDLYSSADPMLGVGAGFLRTYSISCHVFTPPPPKARDHTRPAHGFGVFSSRNQVPERCSRETPRNPNELHSLSGNAKCHALHALI